MSWEKDIYYNPEKFGLEEVGEARELDTMYDHAEFVVWRHLETGDLYYGESAGCSCYGPFEDVDDLDDDDLHKAESIQEIQDALTAWTEGYNKDKRDAPAADLHETLAAL
jgi:hypothetical protein